MKAKGLILSVGLLLGMGSALADTVYWADHNKKKHYDKFVKKSQAEMMYVESPKIKKGETRFLITQTWGCLSLGEGWSEQEYKKLSENSMLLYVGYLDEGKVAFLGYNNEQHDTDIQVLGKEGCSNLNNSEKWEVQQERNGKWVTVAIGIFYYVK